MIQRLRNLFSFPLLTRELTERAARPRTYWTRVIYGVLLYGAFLYNFYDGNGQQSFFVNIGRGKSFFLILLLLQLAGLALFQPALMAGAITSEKERDSLSMLFLTKMSPWRILLEKLFSGIFPMATLLLLSLPLGAVCYAYGGVSMGFFCSILICLVGAWLQIACVALFCSAYFRSTVTAFMMTYFVSCLVYFAVPLLYTLSRLPGQQHFQSSDFYILGDGIDWMSLNPLSVAQKIFLAADLYGYSGTGVSGVMLIKKAGYLSLPLFISAFVFLLLARWVLVRSGGSEHKKSRVFEFFTGWWRRRWAKKTVGHADLPGDNPVAWRETSRGWLAAKEQKVYGLAVGSTLVATICLMLYEAVPVMMITVGILVVMLLCVRAANSIVSERVSQTLDVLLTTKLSAREIIQQKARPVIYFGLLSTIVLSIIYAFIGEEWSLVSLMTRNHRVSLAQEIQTWAILTASTLVCVPLIVWTSLWIGLRIHSRFKVILTSFGVVVGWFILSMAGAEAYYGNNTYGVANVVFGPGGVFKAAMGEISAYNYEDVIDKTDPVKIGFQLMWKYPFIKPLEKFFSNLWMLGVFNVIFYSCISLFIRAICLRNADRLLRR